MYEDIHKVYHPGARLNFFTHEQHSAIEVSKGLLLTMNGPGTYGGGRVFDLQEFYGHQQQQQQQQQRQQQTQRGLEQQQQQQQTYGMPAPCFEIYDPNQNLGLHTGMAYNPTAHIYVPSPQQAQALLPSLLEPIPLDTRVIQRQHPQVHQSHYSVPNDYGLIDPMSTADKLMSSPLGDKIVSSSGMHMHFAGHSTMSSYASLFSDTPAEAARKENTDIWLDTIQISVSGLSGLSLTPLCGSDVLKRVRGKTDDVVTRYLPCVEFLVSCQQELRAGLQAATQKRLYRSNYKDSMTPKQFFSRYLSPLPDKFYNRNKTLMESKVLNDAYTEIKKLCEDARIVEYQGCEGMKNAFLGGMKDGESWGLRKWLSRQGGAMQICTDLECILISCQKLDRSEETTIKLAERLRPLAKQALERLKNDVPSTYQVISTAHPFLPFFHRLESALKGMSNFDPEDDDVICLDDDDEIEEVKKKVATKPVNCSSLCRPVKRARIDASLVEDNSEDQDDDDSVVEVIAACQSPFADLTAASLRGPAGLNRHEDWADLTIVAPRESAGLKSEEDWMCPRCTMLNPADEWRCCMCDKTLSAACDTEDEAEASAFNNTFAELDQKNFADLETSESTTASVSALDGMWELPTDLQLGVSTAEAPQNLSPSMRQNTFLASVHIPLAEITDRLEKLALIFEVNQQENIRPLPISQENFWDSKEQYANALRLLLQILRHEESHQLLDPVAERDQIGQHPYLSLIKNPLCFHDIIGALLNGTDAQSYGDGQLPTQSLRSWNMWRGLDLLHATDLVFLNNLAYNGKERTKERSQTNKLRRILWDGISGIISSHFGPDVEKRKQITPTRRGESSGFVIRK